MAQISDYKSKSVHGLYSFDHFEAPDGSFIQADIRRTYWIYQNVRGDRQKCYSMAELERALME